MISAPSGPVPLSQVANGDSTQDRYSIEHEAASAGQRHLQRQRRRCRAVVMKAQQASPQPSSCRPECIVEFTGAAEAEQQTRNELMLYSGLALALIVMILFVSFHWRANSWLVLANLPFSLIGSVLAIAVTGYRHFTRQRRRLVTVFGVSARNAILQLAHYEHLVEVEPAPWNPRMVLRGANERLIPILMTAAVTALGLAPLAFGIAPTWPGNRRADGDHRAGRTRIIDPAEPAGLTCARQALYPISHPGPACRLCPGA